MLLPSFLFAGLAFHATYAFAGNHLQLLSGHHNIRSILRIPKGVSLLPTSSSSGSSSGSGSGSGSSLNLDNIQSDIFIGMTKRLQAFWFLEITNSTKFKQVLEQQIATIITSTTQMLNQSNQPATAVNIAFSQTGLNAINVTESLGDSLFQSGQAASANALGDPGTSNWVSQFTGATIHVLMMLTSDTQANINNSIATLKSMLINSAAEVYRLDGAARPGDQMGHEHFGYLDGISQPGITGFTTHPVPGQQMVAAGHFVLGETGDATTRPSWAKDGSFLAFRQLAQLVPEFNKFLTDNPIREGDLTPEQGSALLGARMMGRWKSGAPVDLSPLADDPELGADPTLNNNFTFAHPGDDLQSNEVRCPFSAHIRKTAPRADFNPLNTQNHIIRAGIPYGPEVADTEAQSNTTTIERGLAFVSYQSDISQGFFFIQLNWMNNVNFPFGKNDSTPGLDPIAGAAQGGSRIVSGLDPTNSTRDFTLIKDFVQSRGGEYFFAPSIAAITGRLAH